MTTTSSAPRTEPAAPRASRLLAGTRRIARRLRLGAPAEDCGPRAPRRTTLADPGLQAGFERDGYVVVDLLDGGQVAALRAHHESQDHTCHEDWPWVEGFETSLYDPRPGYREQVLVDAEAVVGTSLDRVLDRHRIMFANWVVKAPGAAEVPLHADWTFLDESRFSSVTVWCPLVDVSVELRNGPLGVVVGSHRVIDFLRVANVPAYDRCVAAVEPLERRVPSLRAGQAIIMDNRVVHFSPPNETDDVRVALGCVVGPVEADLHHYWLDDDGRLLRFVLDRSFYFGYAIGRPDLADGVIAVEQAADAAAAHSLR